MAYLRIAGVLLGVLMMSNGFDSASSGLEKAWAMPDERGSASITILFGWVIICCSLVGIRLR